LIKFICDKCGKDVEYRRHSHPIISSIGDRISMEIRVGHYYGAEFDDRHHYCNDCLKVYIKLLLKNIDNVKFI